MSILECFPNYSRVSLTVLGKNRRTEEERKVTVLKIGLERAKGTLIQNVTLPWSLALRKGFVLL